MPGALQLGQLAPMLAEATQLQRERQWNEAAHKYTAALEQTAHLLPPGDLAELYNRRGLCCEKDGDLEQALDDYSEGIERGGAERHSLMYHRGRLYCQLERWSEAEADLRVASSLQPAPTTIPQNGFESAMVCTDAECVEERSWRTCASSTAPWRRASLCSPGGP